MNGNHSPKQRKTRVRKRQKGKKLEATCWIEWNSSSSTKKIQDWAELEAAYNIYQTNFTSVEKVKPIISCNNESHLSRHLLYRL